MALNSKQEIAYKKAPNLQDSQVFTVSQLYQAVNNSGLYFGQDHDTKGHAMDDVPGRVANIKVIGRRRW